MFLLINVPKGELIFTFCYCTDRQTGTINCSISPISGATFFYVWLSVSFASVVLCCWTGDLRRPGYTPPLTQ